LIRKDKGILACLVQRAVRQTRFLLRRKKNTEHLVVLSPVCSVPNAKKIKRACDIYRRSGGRCGSRSSVQQTCMQHGNFWHGLLFVSEKPCALLLSSASTRYGSWG
ncbi:unnamed protein product, partial [Ectocarpus sp. 8 AP-2014]